MMPDLQNALGYRFRDALLLQRALTHRSYSREATESSEPNERLELLGDAVLGLLVTESLLGHFPQHAEGELTKLKAYLVSATHLVKVARRIDLGSHLLLGRGEELTGGRRKKALLADSLEAVVAAVYLDGGLPVARRVVEKIVLTSDSLHVAEEELETGNSKSSLQEWLQARRLPAPSYRVVRESGPPHRRTFIVELCVGDLFSAQAEGSTKKVAEQQAARLAMDHFRFSPEWETADAENS